MKIEKTISVNNKEYDVQHLYTFLNTCESGELDSTTLWVPHRLLPKVDMTDDDFIPASKIIEVKALQMLGDAEHVIEVMGYINSKNWVVTHILGNTDNPQYLQPLVAQLTRSIIRYRTDELDVMILARAVDNLYFQLWYNPTDTNAINNNRVVNEGWLDIDLSGDRSANLD